MDNRQIVVTRSSMPELREYGRDRGIVGLTLADKYGGKA